MDYEKNSFPIPLAHIAFLLYFASVSIIVEVFNSVPDLKMIDSNISP